MKIPTAILVCCLYVGAAHADSLSDADARFKEGMALIKQGNVDGAREKWLQSLALERSAAVLINLAVLEAEAKRPDRALEYLREWFHHPASDERKRAQVEREMLPALEAETARLRIDAEPGSAIVLDGAGHGNAPLRDPIDVMPGKHRISAGERSTELEVHAGETRVIDLRSAAVEKVPAPNPIVLPPPPPPAESRGSWALPITLGAVGVVGVGVGVGLGVVSMNARAEAEQCHRNSACTDPRSVVDRMNATGVGSIVGYVSGGVLLGGAVVSALVIRPWQLRAYGVALVPQLGGMTLSGRF